MTQFDTLFTWMKKPWVIGSYGLLVVLCYCYVDLPLAIYFHQLNLAKARYFFTLTHWAGKWYPYLTLFTLAGFYFYYVKKNTVYAIRAWFLSGCVFLPNLLVLILKITAGRARPAAWFAEHDFGFYWFQFSELYWSFPSGHAVTTAAIASGLGVLFPAYFYALSGLAVFIAISRVILCFHYPSDVMVCVYLGIYSVALFAQYLKKRHLLCQ